MDDILATYRLSDGYSLHIATLSRETIVNAGADHLGFGGYFVFETCDDKGSAALNVLGKASSIEAAFRLSDLWATGRQAA